MDSSPRNNMVLGLQRRGLIKTEQVVEAFNRVDRALFLPASSPETAYADEPVVSPPFHLSAPHIYAMVMEHLALERGKSFLNLGSGTGYLSYLVASIVGPFRANDAVERNAMLVQHARSVCARADELFDLNFINFQVGDAFNLSLSLGSSNGGRYDCIYIGAACSRQEVEEFKFLLSIGGRLVAPVESDFLCIVRESATAFSTRVILNVRFMRISRQEPAWAYDLVAGKEEEGERGVAFMDEGLIVARRRSEW